MHLAEHTARKPRASKPKGRYGKYLRRQFHDGHSFFSGLVRSLEKQQEYRPGYDADEKTDRQPCYHVASRSDCEFNGREFILGA